MVVRVSDTQLRAALLSRGVEPRPDVDRPADAMPPGDAEALTSRLRRLERAIDALAPVMREFADVRVLVDLPEHGVQTERLDERQLNRLELGRAVERQRRHSSQHSTVGNSGRYGAITGILT